MATAPINPFLPATTGSAANTFAELTRQDWNRYLTSYMPAENDLLNYAMDPGTVQRAVDDARGGVAQAFAQQDAASARAARAPGMALTAEEQAVSDRTTGLARALGDVNAGNLTARRVRDRQQSVLGSPVPQTNQQGAK